MNIVHLLAPAHAGGLERVVQGLSIGQQRRGHTVSVAAVVQEPLDGHPFLPPLERAGITVHQIVVPHRAYRRERLEVEALCRRVQPDVVHSHGYRTDVVDGAAIRRLGVATVATNHGPTRGPLRNRIYEYLHWRALRKFDAVIAVSQPIAKLLVSSGTPPSRVHVVPNAWSEIAAPLPREEARRLLKLPQTARVVGWVGRMSREKGIDVFIDTMIELADRTIVGCAIGDGPERAAEQARAEAALGGSRIVWAGMVPEAGRLSRAFDLFVLSSRTEGVPIALLEAAAAGTPVVVTKVGGVPTVVTEREARLVAPERPQELARAIAAAFLDWPDTMERARRASERLAREFGVDAWLDRHEEVYITAQRLRRSSR